MVDNAWSYSKRTDTYTNLALFRAKVKRVRIVEKVYYYIKPSQLPHIQSEFDKADTKLLEALEADMHRAIKRYKFLQTNAREHNMLMAITEFYNQWDWHYQLRALLNDTEAMTGTTPLSMCLYLGYDHTVDEDGGRIRSVPFKPNFIQHMLNEKHCWVIEDVHNYRNTIESFPTPEAAREFIRNRLGDGICTLE